MDSFSTYMDHLILLLAARFQAPLEVCSEELLTPVTAANPQDPWELVSRNVQLSLLAPQTEEERAYVRQVDAHHFSASVCRERARYVQWKLSEKQCNGRLERQRQHHRSLPATAAESANPAAVADTHTDGFDITRDSLRNDVSALYALVRQSLPSTLGRENEDADPTESESDGEAQGAISTTLSSATQTAAAANALSHVREVFVRTAEERQRDEEAARARDEFLSQIQALQTVYFNRYRRWMDVPVNVLEPPLPGHAAASSRASSFSVNDSGNAVQRAGEAATARNGEEEDERAMLLAALKGTRPPPTFVPAQTRAAPVSDVRTGLNPTIAAMRRKVQLQRPVRPSAVSEAALEEIYRDGSGVHEEHRKTRLLSHKGKNMNGQGEPRKSAPVAAAPLRTPAAAAADSAMASGVTVAEGKASATAVAVAAQKETAPPASRRGRWQVVEYDDADDVDSD